MGAEKTAEVGLVIIGTADSTTSVMNDNSSTLHTTEILN